MNPADGVGTPPVQTSRRQPTHPAGARGRWRFLRHDLEMAGAMLALLLRRHADYGGSPHG